MQVANTNTTSNARCEHQCRHWAKNCNGWICIIILLGMAARWCLTKLRVSLSLWFFSVTVSLTNTAIFMQWEASLFEWPTLHRRFECHAVQESGRSGRHPYFGTLPKSVNQWWSITLWIDRSKWILSIKDSNTKGPLMKLEYEPSTSSSAEQEFRCELQKNLEELG